MAGNVAVCLGIAAPYYNLAMVAVVVVLFLYLFSLPKPKKGYHEPWKFLFLAVLIFIVEELMTVLRSAGIVSFPGFIFGVFEMGIVGLFIYMCLLQKEHLKK